MLDAPTVKPRYRVKAGSAPSLSLSGTLTPLGGPGGLPAGAGNVPHQGASTGRRLGNWRPAGSGPNAIVSLSAPELVRRSRDLRRNQPSASRAMDLLTAHIGGLGIKPRPLCQHKKTREALVELWADWTAVADADSVLDFYGLQSLAISEMIEAGEAFARLRPRRLSDGLPVPLQVQLIPAEQVPLFYSVANGPNPIVQAIEHNPLGARTAFWIYPQHPSDAVFLGSIVPDMTPRRVVAEDIAHLFNCPRIGQQRGLPWLAPVVAALQQTGQYLDAELLRKQLVAAMVGFVKKPITGEVGMDDLREMWPAPWGSGGEREPVSIEAGSMQYLDPGEEVQFNGPADVGGSFGEFVATQLRSIAAGSNLMYEELTGDWSKTNDRTYRAAFNTFKRQCRQWQWNLVCQQFNVPIWNRFVEFAVSSGKIAQVKSVTDADLFRVEWRPERWDYIQPVQDVQASALALGLGLTSRTAEIAERGDDAEVIDQQIADDRAREADLGLEFPAGTSKAAVAPTATLAAESEAAASGDPAPADSGPPQQQGQGAVA